MSDGFFRNRANVNGVEHKQEDRGGKRPHSTVREDFLLIDVCLWKSCRLFKSATMGFKVFLSKRPFRR